MAHLSLNLKMDNRWFGIVVGIIIIIIVYMLNYGDTNISLISYYPNVTACEMFPL